MVSVRGNPWFVVFHKTQSPLHRLGHDRMLLSLATLKLSILKGLATHLQGTATHPETSSPTVVHDGALGHERRRR